MRERTLVEEIRDNVVEMLEDMAGGAKEDGVATEGRVEVIGDHFSASEIRDACKQVATEIGADDWVKALKRINFPYYTEYLFDSGLRDSELEGMCWGGLSSEQKDRCEDIVKRATMPQLMTVSALKGMLDSQAD